MRKLAFLVAAGLCFGLAPFTPRLGPVAGSVALVALAVVLAVAASGVAASLAVAGGAVGVHSLPLTAAINWRSAWAGASVAGKPASNWPASSARPTLSSSAAW